MRPEKELLEAYRELYPTDAVQLADLRGKYISPKERKIFEMFYGEACVKQVFGEPTHLDKAEILLFEVQEGKLSEASKCQNLIEITKQIAETCIEKEISNFRNLHTTGIPVMLFEKRKKVLQIHFSELQPSIAYVSIQELEIMKEWATSPEAESELNVNKKATLKYILEVVYVSLDLIVKEIRGKISA